MASHSACLLAGQDTSLCGWPPGPHPKGAHLGTLYPHRKAQGYG